MSSWDAAERWYSQCVGEKGHHYHQAAILPGALRMLDLKNGSSLLDLGCGQGVLARKLPENIEYLGVDLSIKLIEEARRQTKNKRFVIADICAPLPIEKMNFDAACFILSLQNMEYQENAIANAARHLKEKGKLVIVLNHPCFRVPRQSSWGMDETTKSQYRRIHRYMTPMKIPLQIHPSKGEKSEITYSFHHPFSHYSMWLEKQGFSITHIEEWCSDKKSSGAKARMEDRARSEIPLFLALTAIVSKKKTNY